MTGKDNDPIDVQHPIVAFDTDGRPLTALYPEPGPMKSTEATEATYVPDDADRWRQRAEYEHSARNELGRAIDDIAVAIGLPVMTPADAVVREVQRRAGGLTPIVLDMQGQPLTIEVARRAANDDTGLFGRPDPDQHPVVAIDTNGQPVTALYPEHVLDVGEGRVPSDDDPDLDPDRHTPPFIREQDRRLVGATAGSFERPSIRKVEMRNAWWRDLVSVSLALENVGAPVRMPLAESVAVPRYGYLSCWRLWTDAVDGDDAVYLSAVGPPMFEATLTADRPSAYYRHHTVEGLDAGPAAPPPRVLLSRDARLVECDRPTWELDFSETHPDIRPGGRTRAFVMAPGPNHKGWSVAVVTGAPGEDYMSCLTLRPMVR